MLKLTLLFVCAALASRTLPPLGAWREFKQQFGKIYTAEEETVRFGIFTQNLHRIKQMNDAVTETHEHRARYGVTKFSDLTPEEFKMYYLNYKPAPRSVEERESRKLQVNHAKAIPTSFDWNSRGAVTPVKNQGQCGSCWAFSTTETVESQWFLAGYPLPVLSEQQIVDCDTENGNMGCDGGDTTTAYEYIIQVGGLESEASYPYTAEDDTCAFNKAEVVATLTNWTYVTTTKNETEMVGALYEKGPLSICVDAESWQFYIGGIIQALCGTSLDHCVQITGFNTYNEILWQVPYWVIRNSWGADWGLNGYLWVERNKDLCGVAEEVTLPVVTPKL